MNRGVLESPPVQQLVAAGNPDWWWNVNGIRAPRPTAIPPFLSAAAVSNYSPSLVVSPYAPIPPSSSSWEDYTQELPESWSQLLLGGLAGDEEEDRKSGISNFQAKRLETWQEQEAKRLETWQEQALEYSPYVSSAMENVKQENSTSSYLYEHSNDQDFHLGAVKSSASNWSSLTSSPKSCIASYKLNNNVLDFSKMNKSRAKHPPPSRSAESNSNAAGGSQKKARVQSSSTQSTFKVRKEKLGDRITALHQLVSPFGKTDTASVLLEAIGYIRFLQSQIEALSLPYLGRNPGNLRHKVQDQDQRNCIFPEDPGQLLNENGKRRKGAPDQQECVGEDRTKDWRSRGLCLVPISCTLQVGSETSNGADYWAPASLGGGGEGGGVEASINWLIE